MHRWTRAKHGWIGAAVASAISVVGIVALMPRLTNAPWQAISSAWREITWWNLALLSLLWAAGLLAHSTVLMGAMPGLTRRRAMTLNLTGSAVSNVLPLGGGLGVGLNYVMVRRWGFSSGQFSLFTVLSNVWTVVAKAALPCLAVTLLIARDVSIDQRILVGAVVGSTVIALATGVALAIASSDRGARFAGRAAQVLPRFGQARHDGAHVEARLIALRHSGAVIVRASWRRMTLGMVTYYALGALLLWASFHVVGSTLGPVAVLTLFAFERAVTTLPITPGGSGVAEVATTALAIALNGPHDNAVVAAGVLLYRAFTFGLEIPVGGVWLLGWLLLQRSRRAPEMARLPVALGEAA